MWWSCLGTKEASVGTTPHQRYIFAPAETQNGKSDALVSIHIKVFVDQWITWDVLVISRHLYNTVHGDLLARRNECGGELSSTQLVETLFIFNFCLHQELYK